MEFDFKISKQSNQLLPELYFMPESNVTLDPSTLFLPMPV